jgi:hypothetical protein
MLVSVIACIVEFMINETLVVLAQLNGNINSNSTTAINSTDPEGKNIVLTWIEPNDTKTYRIPMMNVSIEDFWKTFVPLLKSSTNEPVSTLE